MIVTFIINLLLTFILIALISFIHGDSSNLEAVFIAMRISPIGGFLALILTLIVSKSDEINLSKNKTPILQGSFIGQLVIGTAFGSILWFG